VGWSADSHIMDFVGNRARSLPFMPSGSSSPRVSINQLATYLVSTPTQRRRLIQKAKNPPTFQVNWYDPARQAINQFIASNMVDESILVAESARLLGITPASDHEESRFRTNAEAIDAFLDCYDQIDLADHTLACGPNAAPTLNVQGVEISVRPEFTSTGMHRGQPVCGGVKLYFSKDDPLTEVSAPYIAAVLMQHVQTHHQPSGHVTRHDSCMVIDVFGKCIHTAPRATARRFQDIDVSCQEVRLWWPQV
jgi:hypothetical protein